MRTFYDKKISHYVILGHVRRPLSPFHGRPWQCYKCVKYNHREVACNGLLTWSHSNDFHASIARTSTHEKCSNFGRNHPVTAFCCPIRNNQNGILEYTNAKSVKFRTARAALSSLPQRKSSASADPSHKSDENLQYLRHRTREVDSRNDAMMVQHNRHTYASKSGARQQALITL